MPAPVKQRFWQKCRRTLRWCRFLFYGLIVFLLGCLLYLNRIGLPDFLKKKLVAELRSHGVALEFARMRLRWLRGLVAEDVSLGRAAQSGGPELSIAEVAIKLDPAALVRLRLHASSLMLRNGRLVVPLVATNEPPQRFVVENIETELRLLPDDQWELDKFQALCFGARVNLSGTLTNASAVRKWQFQRTTNQAPDLWLTQLRHANRIVQEMRFGQPPEINLDIRGDASDPASITADFRFNARRAETVWGKLDKLVLATQLNRPTGSNQLGRSTLKLMLQDASTSWGDAKLGLMSIRWQQAVTNAAPADVDWDFELFAVDSRWGRTPHVRLAGRTIQSSDQRVLLNTEVTLHADAVESVWGRSETNFLTAQLIHAPDNFAPVEADWQWQISAPQTRWGAARDVHLSGHLDRVSTNTLPRADASWAAWANLEPFHIDWDAQVNDVIFTNVQVDRVTLAGRWQAPELAIEELHADLYQRRLDAAGRVNVASREALAQAEFNFDVHRLASLLKPETRRWLEQYTWTEPPDVAGSLRVVLPAWTNTQPDWRAEVLPSLQLAGELAGRNAAFRDVPVESAKAHFIFSNLTWELPDFVAVRPEGRVEFAYRSHALTREYHFKGRSALDPLALKPLLEEKQQKAFDYFRFSAPPEVEGEVWGRWREPEKTGFAAHLRGTNFFFRREMVSDLAASVQFTNRFVTATDVLIHSGDQQISAPAVGFDTATQTLYLTNAVGTMEPERITRAIGPKTAKSLSPYVFSQPPTARADGFAQVRTGKHADMKFVISGGPFSYWKFRVPQISGTVHWVDETVNITNLQAAFYGGPLDSDIFVDFSPDTNANLRLMARVTDADLHALMSDLSSPTNRLEGIFSGNLTITRANTGDWNSWQGFGSAQLRDGYLWDIPLFGIFSPVLDAMMPGVGNSRVSGGGANFSITNSVINTDDMEIRSPAMRLAYRGTIDFGGRVNARVEARPLRDAWVIGPVVSLVFSPLTKLFEYKVTGTLKEPEKVPLYVPKEFLFPFHPLRTLKELFGEEKAKSPPKNEPKPPSP
jgi:hypothetical protein